MLLSAVTETGGGRKFSDILKISHLITMKFGHNLPRNQVPEWSSNYISYKGLKKLIKAAAKAVNDGQEADLAGLSR